MSSKYEYCKSINGENLPCAGYSESKGCDWFNFPDKCKRQHEKQGVASFQTTNSVRDAIVALYARWSVSVARDSDHTQVDQFIDWVQQQHP